MTAFLGLLARHDQRIFAAVVRRRVRAIDRLMRCVTHLGDASVTIGAATALSLGAIPDLQSAGKAAAFLLLASHLGVQLLKRGVSRPRPTLPMGAFSLIRAPDRFSFPSGHAAASLSLVLPLATAAPLPLSTFLLLLAGLVGFSRCYLGVHYPGDVLVGWLLVIVAHWFSFATA